MNNLKENLITYTILAAFVLVLITVEVLFITLASFIPMRVVLVVLAAAGISKLVS
jgi:hypothetical protein